MKMLPCPGATPRSLLGPRRCSHVARVHTNNGRRTPERGDDAEERDRWLERSLLPKPRPPAVHRSSPAPQPPQQLDWRDYRAKLVAVERAAAAGSSKLSRTSSRPSRPLGTFSSSAWAHELPGPEPGCLLLARQENMGFFDRAVVLLATHDPKLGSVGFVLNKPCPLRLAEMQDSPAAKGVLDAFGAQQLQLGGPVQLDSLTLLHAYAGLSGAQKVSEGVFFGGVPAAVQLVRCGLAKPHHFKLLLGVSGWAPGQLQDEINAGSWHVVAAAKDLVLPPPGANSKPPERLFERLLQLIGHH